MILRTRPAHPWCIVLCGGRFTVGVDRMFPIRFATSSGVSPLGVQLLQAKACALLHIRRLQVAIPEVHQAVAFAILDAAG